jgi:hypothetical protein
LQQGHCLSIVFTTGSFLITLSVNCKACSLPLFQALLRIP